MSFTPLSSLCSIFRMLNWHCTPVCVCYDLRWLRRVSVVHVTRRTSLEIRVWSKDVPESEVFGSTRSVSIHVLILHDDAIVSQAILACNFVRYVLNDSTKVSISHSFEEKIVSQNEPVPVCVYFENRASCCSRERERERERERNANVRKMQSVAVPALYVVASLQDVLDNLYTCSVFVLPSHTLYSFESFDMLFRNSEHVSCLCWRLVEWILLLIVSVRRRVSFPCASEC